MNTHLISAAAVLGVTLALTGVAANAGPAGKVVVLESSAWAVAPGSTWTWAPTTTAGDPRLDNDILQDRLRLAVEAALAAKGLRRVDAGAPARYVVSYHVDVDRRVDVRTVPNVHAGPTVCGWRGCVRGVVYGGSSVDVRQYAEGTLVLDVVDRATGKLVWQAASKKKVTPKDAEQGKLNAVVADMTRGLPTV